jgi:hypothetical protein
MGEEKKAQARDIDFLTSHFPIFSASPFPLCGSGKGGRGDEKGAKKGTVKKAQERTERTNLLGFEMLFVAKEIPRAVQ